MAGSDDLSGLVRMSNNQSGCALKERVKQMNPSSLVDIMKPKDNCRDPCMSFENKINTIKKCMSREHTLLASHVFSFIEII